MGYPTYGIKAFTHLTDSKLFVGESSSTPPGYEVFRAPAGMFMYNDKTGAKVAFEKVGEEYDGEGELMFEAFVPTSQSVAKHPALMGYALHLFND